MNYRKTRTLFPVDKYIYYTCVNLYTAAFELNKKLPSSAKKKEKALYK